MSNIKAVLLRDLIGTPPIKVDQRTRNADGSLKYPEQQQEPRITTLQRVYTKRQDGKLWLMWEWDRGCPQTPFCNYSGFVFDSQHANNYAIGVLTEGPTVCLGENAEEAQRLLYAGRRPELLKEGRTFDETRLEASPLFANAGRQGRLL